MELLFGMSDFIVYSIVWTTSVGPSTQRSVAVEPGHPLLSSTRVVVVVAVVVGPVLAASVSVVNAELAPLEVMLGQSRCRH